MRWGSALDLSQMMRTTKVLLSSTASTLVSIMHTVMLTLKILMATPTSSKSTTCMHRYWILAFFCLVTQRMITRMLSRIGPTIAWSPSKNARHLTAVSLAFDLSDGSKVINVKTTGQTKMRTKFIKRSPMWLNMSLFMGHISKVDRPISMKLAKFRISRW